MLPMIPQELSDLILDFLHDDVAALCSAGLVCRSWLPASRFHLFSDIKLQMDNVHHRLEVICAECSTIPPYILSLKIEGDECQFVDEALLRLPLLSNLKSLSLREIYMAILTPDVKKWLTTLLQNLTALYLNNFSFETVDQAVDFIASAPCLEDIMFTNVGCSKDCNHSSQAIAPPLKRFRCEPDPLVINIMEWFCRCYPTPSLHTLEIIDLTMDDNIPTVCKFIRHLGSALENLTISCYDSDRNREVQIALSKGIDLSHHISLRNISFNNILLYTDWWRNHCANASGWIISILSSIAHPFLETVTISIGLDYVGELDVLELPALQRLFLNQPLSNSSTKLRFDICSGFIDREVVLAALKDGLPKLDEKKRLEFVLE